MLTLIAVVSMATGLRGPGLANNSDTPVAETLATITAEPPLPHPNTQPVVVPLFDDFAFADYNPKPFRYAPPAKAKAWAKIILVADFSVTAGVQFDRTAQIAIGKANVFFGTTAEPSPNVAPAWHVERDITDYCALLKSAQPGIVDIGNTVDKTYTGVIHGSAKLLFYPADKSSPAPAIPDRVLPLETATGLAAGLAGSTGALAGKVACPANVVRAYLDVIAQSQGSDEFWYTNVPDDLSPQMHQGGGSAFRECEVAVDGRPAGIAPIFPWIYTGGIDPSLWRPIPGVQTLNFAPYRVDLTPFAGVLSNGEPHTITVSVFNAQDHFSVTATLLLYCDPSSKYITGAITEDTIAEKPAPTVKEDIKVGKSGDANGTIAVASARRFAISGYVMTSHGKITTRISTSSDFSNRQQYLSTPTGDSQNIRQSSALTTITTALSGDDTYEQHLQYAYPLIVDMASFSSVGKSHGRSTTIRQGYHLKMQRFKNGRLIFSSALSNEVSPSDAVSFDINGKFLGHHAQQSAQAYDYDDSLGGHYYRLLKADGGKIISADKKN